MGGGGKKKNDKNAAYLVPDPKAVASSGLTTPVSHPFPAPFCLDHYVLPWVSA